MWEAHDLVCQLPQLHDGVRRTHRDREYDAAGPSRAQRRDGSARREPGRQPVVDHDGGAPTHGRRGALPPVARDAALHLCTLGGGDSIELRAGDAQRGDRPPVDDADAAFGDRADAELWLSRTSQLAHDEHVQGSTQPRGDLGADRNATAWERQHDRPVVTMSHQLGCELPAGVCAVAKAHRLRPLWSICDPGSCRPPSADRDQRPVISWRPAAH